MAAQATQAIQGTEATDATQAIPESSAASQNGNVATEKVRVVSPRKRPTVQKFRDFAIKYNPWTALKRYRDYRQQTKQVPKRKAPFTLGLYGVLILLASEILILVAVTILWVLSTRNNGFVEVPNTASTIDGSQNSSGSLLWGGSVLWTFLPAFVVSMCGALFSTTLQALEDCQPTIELRKNTELGRKSRILPFRRSATSPEAPKRSTAKLTVLLDYRSEWIPILDTYRAFRNKHLLISVCMLVKWSFAAIGPLSSAIISVGNVSSSTYVNVTSSTFFDGWRNQSSSRAAFESTSAILFNGGSPYPWTTMSSSVVPFFDLSGPLGNLTADTRTYSASLDCQAIDIDSLRQVGNVTLQDQDGGSLISFYFTDRGCSVATWIALTPEPPLYSQTRYETCPLETDQARLVFIAGGYDPSSAYLLGNASLISCIPFFWKSSSRVTVPSGANTIGPSGKIIGIVTNLSSVERFWPKFWSPWMYKIPQYKIEDPTPLSDSDDFGRVVYNYAKQSNETADIVQSLNTTFSILFAAFATTSTYSPLAENSTSTGTLSRPASRLFVVFFPAMVVTIVMATSFLVTVWIAAYAYHNRFILPDHLDLILGHAILLEENERVGDFIQAVKENATTQAGMAARVLAGENNNEEARGRAERAAVDAAARNGDLVKHAKKVRGLNQWSCWVDDDGKLWMEEPEQVTGNLTQAKLSERILRPIQTLWGWLTSW